MEVNFEVFVCKLSFSKSTWRSISVCLHYPIIVSSIILKLITFNVGEIGLLGTQTDMKSSFCHYILAPFGTRKEYKLRKI